VAAWNGCNHKGIHQIPIVFVQPFLVHTHHLADSEHVGERYFIKKSLGIIVGSPYCDCIFGDNYSLLLPRSDKKISASIRNNKFVGIEPTSYPIKSIPSTTSISRKARPGNFRSNSSLSEFSAVSPPPFNFRIAEMAVTMIQVDGLNYSANSMHTIPKLKKNQSF
jgi:hypothetical protein